MSEGFSKSESGNSAPKNLDRKVGFFAAAFAALGLVVLSGAVTEKVQAPYTDADEQHRGIMEQLEGQLKSIDSSNTIEELKIVYDRAGLFGLTVSQQERKMRSDIMDAAFHTAQKNLLRKF